MDLAATKDAIPPNVEALTDVARDIQYYAEGKGGFPFFQVQGFNKDGLLLRSVKVQVTNEPSLPVSLLLVEIGSNDQKFRLDFDTGSSDLWVPDSTCKTKRVAFNRATSTSFKPVKGKFQIR